MVAAILAMRSARLRRRFEKMGRLIGRPLAEIIEVAGKPSHRGRIDEHREMVEWRRINFHIALTFTDGVCDGIAYQGR
jgi:hypothetical protein